MTFAGRPPRRRVAASSWNAQTWCAIWLPGMRRKDTTQRGTALAELEQLIPRTSQHLAGQEVPEENWLYRFAKKHWFFGFGAYT